MDFSDLIKATCCSWSPNGRFIATAVDQKLFIRDIQTLKITSLHTCLDNINSIEWSFDSMYILCAQLKRGVVQVWCVDDSEWFCKIEEGPAGLAHARWSADGRHILNCNDFQIRMTIWSLCNRSVAYVKNPKYPVAGCSFSNDRHFMAIAERKECKDYISIYSVDDWSELQNFAVDTKDLEDLKWSPDDRVIAVWDNCIDYLLLIYTPDGRLQHKLRAYDNALGIKSVTWSPSSQFLSVGSYDQKARILNTQSWRCMAEYEALETVTGGSVVVYKERDVSGAYPAERINEYGAEIVGKSTYELVEGPVSIPSVKPHPDKPNPKLGIGLAAWSADSCFLAFRNDNMPSVLWIWDTARLALASVVVHLTPIRSIKWSPTQSRLALCTGNRTIYFWSTSGCACVECPEADFRISDLEWNPTGDALILHDKDRVCLSFLAQ